MLHTHVSHQEAVARISWCVQERAIGLVTGEVAPASPSRSAPPWPGSTQPKHRHLPRQPVGGHAGPLHDDRLQPRRHARASPGLAHPPGPEALATEEDERGRSVVLVLDEAHMLDAEQLEGLRMLTNVNIDSHSPFACVLVGQPTSAAASASVLSPP